MVIGHHIAGSAPMGVCGSNYTVTDGTARVCGVEGLRVADISLFPSTFFYHPTPFPMLIPWFTAIPHANPAGVVMMIGEKVAAQILKDYGVGEEDEL